MPRTCPSCQREVPTPFGKPVARYVCRWCGFDIRERPRRHKTAHFERYISAQSEDAGRYLDQTDEGQYVDD